MKNGRKESGQLYKKNPKYKDIKDMSSQFRYINYL